MERKIVAIDARMVEMSGIGVYIQHLLGRGIYDYALGDESIIRKYDKDVKVISYDAKIYGPKEQLLFPGKKVKEAGITLIHFPHYNVPISYRGEYVATVHDLTHIVYPEFLGSRLKAVYASFLMKNTLRRAKHIFTVSENSKKDIVNYFVAAKEKISIAYAATDNSFCVRHKADIIYLYDKFGIPRGKKILLYVGNLKPHKNLPVLLKSLSELDNPDIILLLVGKAFKNMGLEEEEEALGIKSRVFHTGMVSNEELVDFYNLADVFVFPSLYEGFGVPPLEAMACGTPVICSDNSSIPEVVGDAAYMFDANNPEQLKAAIRKVLTDGELYDKLIKKGFERCKMFSWDETAKKVKNMISRL
jgi:glycosyltransferase involved in cell wall biosynthesis